MLSVATNYTAGKAGGLVIHVSVALHRPVDRSPTQRRRRNTNIVYISLSLSLVQRSLCVLQSRVGTFKKSLIRSRMGRETRVRRVGREGRRAGLVWEHFSSESASKKKRGAALVR